MLVEKDEMPAARRAATRLLKGVRPEEARATIVPVSAGEPDLLTLRAVRAMQEADAIVFLAGTDPALVAMGRRDAERVEVPLEASIPELALVAAARAQDGHHVSVLIDGTASDHLEIATELQARGISTSILPGIADVGEIPIRPNIAA
jgi:siroheme synthase